MPLSGTNVIILAGGYGTRLKDAFDGPKVLAPVAGRPFLEHLLEQAVGAGCRRIILALGYRAAEVAGAAVAWQSVLGKRREVELVLVVEPRQEGDSMASGRAARCCPNDPALLMNGDTYVAADLAEFVGTAEALLHMNDGRGVIVPEPFEGRHVGWVYASPGPLVRFAPKTLVPAEMIHVPGAFPFVDIGTPEGWAGAEKFLRGRGVIR